MSRILQFREYRKLYRLAINRLNSAKDYCALEEFQGELLARYLESRGVLLKNHLALDLGCGLGGYGIALQRAGLRVIGLDMFPPVDLTLPPMISGDALQLPFSSGKFDLIICASLIEHVPNPQSLLIEILRVLKTNGVVYLSFPPYYSPRGGHQFSPFHLFGEDFAIRMQRQRELFKGRGWLQAKYPMHPSSFKNAFGKWGLYRVTISSIKNDIRKLPLEILDCSTRWLPINFSRIPVLGEFLTWHVQFLLRKK